MQIVITGVGSLSSVGIGTDSHYQALLDGKNGIETLPEWAEEYPCKVCGIAVRYVCEDQSGTPSVLSNVVRKMSKHYGFLISSFVLYVLVLLLFSQQPTQHAEGRLADPW